MRHIPRKIVLIEPSWQLPQDPYFDMPCCVRVVRVPPQLPRFPMESSRSSRGLDSLEGPSYVLVSKDNTCSPLNDDPYRATLFLKSPSAQPLDIHCWTNHSSPQPETGQLSVVLPAAEHEARMDGSVPDWPPFHGNTEPPLGDWCQHS